MFCVNCFRKTTNVTNSRPRKGSPSVWRRRKCASCNTLFTTIERPSLSDNKLVFLPEGKSDTFNLGRLIISIAASFSHDPKKSKYDSLWLAQTIEDTLSTEYSIFTVDDIAAVTHQTLRKFDELAAIQYAAKHQLITSTRRPGRPSVTNLHRRIDE